MAKEKSAQFPNVIALGLIWLLSLSFLTPVSPAAASPDEVKWSRVNIPTEGKPGDWVLADGSDVQHLTMAIDGTLYAYGKGLTYTLYRSTNGGYSWPCIGEVNDNIVDIATAPDDGNTIYYATSSGIHRSTDGGKKFTPLPSNPGGAGTNNIEITSIDVAQLNSSNIIAVSARDTDNTQFGGIYTLDEAEALPSWTDSGLSGYDVYTVSFSPNFAADRQLVAVVTDETDTFVTTKIGDAGWGSNIGNGRLDRDNSGISVVVATSAAIAFPTDYDASEDYAQFIAIDTGIGDGDVYRINSVGAPGTSIATDLNIGSAYGLSNVDVTGLAATGDAAAVNLLAGASDSAQTYFSTDSGINWTRSRKAPTGGSKTCVLMATDSNMAYAATSGNESAFSISQDNAVTWNQIGLIDTDIGNIVDLAPSPSYFQDNTLFMLTFGGEHSLWRSLNGGDTWERIFASALTNIDRIDLVELSPQYDNGSHAVFIAGRSSGRPAIWKSTDNGQNFIIRFTFDRDTGASLPIDTWAIVNDDTLFIGSWDGTNGRVYHTTKIV